MKKILMSMRVTEATNYKEERNSIAYEYIEYFENLGYLVQLVPNNTKHLKNYFDDDIAGIILTGGNNVNPKLYGNDEILSDVYPLRDNLEKELIQYAINKNIHILGICRGFHFLNVFYGGSISHNIENHVNKIHILKSSVNILDNKNTNSYHNQAIKEENLSKELKIIAKSEDGIIEAFKHNKDKVLAIQWHPERQNEIYDKELIKNFLEGKI